MTKEDEVNLKHILFIFSSRWKYLITLALVFLLGALIKHKYFPSYPGTGKLIIKDFRNSQLQSAISRASGAASELAMGDAKGDDLSARAETFLNTHEFFLSVAQRLLSLKQTESSNTLKAFFAKYNMPESNPEFLHVVANDLFNIINFNSNKSDILIVNTKSGNRALSVVLTNETLKEAQQNLIQRELDELNQAENYFKLEIELVRTKLDWIENATIKKMQKNQMISVDMEKGESAKYIVELRKRINGAQIDLANNEEKIQALLERIDKTGGRNLGVISKFNESSQVKILEDQDRELALELKTYQAFLSNFEKQKSGLVPFQYELEKMNISHDFEYKIYASLSDSLAKIGLQKTYARNKIEILELERYSNIKSSPGAVILVLLSLMISQVFGVFSIYLFELLKT